jgi:hypothetical protein
VPPVAHRAHIAVAGEQAGVLQLPRIHGTHCFHRRMQRRRQDNGAASGLLPLNLAERTFAGAGPAVPGCLAGEELG